MRMNGRSSVKSSGKTLKNKKAFGGKKKKKPKNIYVLEDNTPGNTEELIPKAEVSLTQKEIPLIHNEDESDWERKEDFGMDWGKELKNLKISDKIKCDSDDDWDNEDAFPSLPTKLEGNTANNSPSSSHSPQLKHDLAHGKKETLVRAILLI
uniref:Uncharacterized protein n=1 Tax=Meloidogyne enterolobii TaxID=390850 RepID=A0A6V7WJK9_MELEN|nr:unnamed protein product [Meloidogyne enterolobii]